MAQQLESIQFKISYGHDATHVIVQFTQPITLARFTPAETEAMIEQMQVALKMLRDFQLKAMPLIDKAKAN